jgi:hypothetical protein
MLGWVVQSVCIVHHYVVLITLKHKHLPILCKLGLVIKDLMVLLLMIKRCHYYIQYHGCLFQSSIEDSLFSMTSFIKFEVVRGWSCVTCLCTLVYSLLNRSILLSSVFCCVISLFDMISNHVVRISSILYVVCEVCYCVLLSCGDDIVRYFFLFYCHGQVRIVGLCFIEVNSASISR